MSVFNWWITKWDFEENIQFSRFLLLS